MSIGGRSKKDADEIYGYQTLYREIGYYIAHLEQYERSLKFFDLAVQKNPLDKRALIGRSKARAKVTSYKGALEDINNALAIDSDDLNVLAHKALGTYLSCEFEEGLVQNNRLLPKRQKPEHFSLGIMHCSDAIENCVGERTGRPLRDHFKIVRKLAWKWNAEAQKPYEPKPKHKKKRKSKFLKAFEDKCKPAAETNEKKMARTRKESGKSADSKNPGDIADDLRILDSLTDHTTEEIEVPPLQPPYPFKPVQRYTTNIENYMAEKYLGKLQDRQSEELKEQRKMAKKEADVILTKLEKAYNQGMIKSVLELAEKLKHYCDKIPKKVLPDKDMYFANIYDKICKAFYEMYKVNKKRNEYIQEKQICVQLGLRPSIEVSIATVVEEFQHMVVDNKKQLKLFEQRLGEAATPEEVCWCYHELARYNLDLKHYEMSRVYSRKCIQEGKRIGNIHWALNCQMLLVRCSLQQNNKNAAKQDVKDAQKLAVQLKDEELEKYLEKCMWVIDDARLDGSAGQPTLEQREATIINIMTREDMKAEIALLFKQMSNLPNSRKLTIMPGAVQEENKDKKKGRAMSISVKPGSSRATDDDVSEMGTKRHSKFVKNEEKREGAHFLDMI